MAKSLIGIVMSDKADKSIVVSVVTPKRHPIYKKQYKVSKRFLAHDEKNEAKVGDRVQVVETRPLSARKHHTLDKILERAAIAAEKTVDAIALDEEPGAIEHPKSRAKQDDAVGAEPAPRVKREKK